MTDELTEHTAVAGTTDKGRRLLKLLGARIDDILDPPPVSDTQRVTMEQQRAAREDEQRVIDESPIITIPRLTDAQPIALTRNPTAKRDLRATPRLHRRTTRNNTPGINPSPILMEPIPVIPGRTA